MSNSVLWKIIYNNFDPAKEKLRESLLALGNGYFETRGSAPEVSASEIHYPGTYLNGIYNKLDTKLNSHTVCHEDLVNCPNWLPITFKVGNDEWFHPSPDNIFFYHQELDLKSGLSSRKLLFKNKLGQKTFVKTRRIVHLNKPHLAAIEYTIIPKNYNQWISVKALLDGSIINSGVERYKLLNGKHWLVKSVGKFNQYGTYLVAETSYSKIEISVACKVSIFEGDKIIKPKIKYFTHNKEIVGQEFKFFARQGKSYRIEKIVSIYTSQESVNPKKLAIDEVKKAEQFSKLYQSHRRAWHKAWKSVNLMIDGDDFSQKALRFHIFHLIQTASVNTINMDVGIPARGLNGEAYRGHIFWDESFILPFYNFHFPEISKSLLLYRYRRLNKAREYALENGFQGAMFPWQSASSGKEETPVVHLNPISGDWNPDTSHNQRHVAFAVAYNFWQHWQNTGDLNFLNQFGAETILSIARFGASFVKYKSSDKRYHTVGAMGPDEFHEKYPHSSKLGLEDNAYTNLMIVWTLLKAQEVLDVLTEPEKERIIQKIKLKKEELIKWGDITKRMKLVIDKKGIIAQFDGYFDLKELDLNKYKTKYGNIYRLDRILKAENDSADKYQIAKQADVLMFFYLIPLEEAKKIFQNLGYNFSLNLLKTNYDYYFSRTSHGSTLSKVAFCLLSHQLGDMEETEKMFKEVLNADFRDLQGGTTKEGIHLGVMGGSLDIVLRGFLGLDSSGANLKINPKLPENWVSIELPFFYHNKRFNLSLDKKNIAVKITGLTKKSFLTTVEIKKKIYQISSGKTFKISLL